MSTDQEKAGRPFYVKWQHILPVFLTALVIADVVSAIEQSMMFSAFKAIIEDTGDPIGAGWLVSAYYVVAGPAAVVAGRLGDMYGRKLVLLAVLLIVLAGSVLSGLSSDMIGIIVGRGMQGVSGAIIPLCVGIYRENAPTEKLGLGLGILLSAHAIGTLLGLLIGGAVVDLHHWRYIFIVAAGFALFALLAVLLFAPSTSRRAPQRMDWLGLTVAPIIASLLYGVSSLNSPLLSITQALGIIAVSLALLMVWGWHELRHDQPLVDLRAFKNRNVLLANITSVITSIGPSQVSLYFTLLLQQPRWTGVGFGQSASMAGVWKSPINIFSASLGPIAGHMTTKFGPQWVLLVGAALQTVGWILVLFVNQNFWPFLVITFICSSGSAITNVGIVGTVTMATPKEKTGEALGAVAVTRSFGNALGSQVIALLLSLSVVTGAQGKSFPSPTAHLYVLLFIAAFAVLTLLVALAFRRPAAAARTEPEAAAPEMAA